MKKLIEEKIFCEIDTHGGSAIREAFDKISEMLAEHPGSVKLYGSIILEPIRHNCEIIWLDLDMKNPTLERLQEKFSELPDSHHLHGVLILNTGRGPKNPNDHGENID